MINILKDEFIYFKKDPLLKKLVLILYLFMPIFLIMGTAISEFAILLICFYFIYDFIFNKKNIFKNKLLYPLLILYFSLIINLIFSENFSNSFLRNFFFFKYFIFVLGTINFLTENKFRISFLFKLWLVILIIFAMDMFVQFFVGKNIIGMESPLKLHRISGFMGDELKAGALLLSFSFITCCFFIQNTNYKNFGIILILFFLAAIFISGDRSNFIKSVLSIIFISFFFEKVFVKKIIIMFTILVCFILVIFSNYSVYNERFNNKLFKDLANQNYNLINYVNETEYGKLYHTGIVLFKDYKLFGVGNKNFRLLCEKNFKEKFLKKHGIEFNENNIKEKFEEKFRCNTHPHQVYIEILSEHGLFGFIILISLLFFFIKKNFLYLYSKKNILLSCQFVIILITFIPILPGGSFFTSFNSSIFWMNVALFYSYKKIIT